MAAAPSADRSPLPAAPAVLRDLPLRRLGIGLVAYGGVGVLLLLVGLFVLAGVLGRLDALSGAVGRPLASTARTVADASTAFDRFGDSLVQARESSEHAAQLSRDTAQTLAGLADAMTIRIFGAQPLLPAAEGFRRSSEQLTGLGGDLDQMSEALGANVDDVEQASRNLSQVRAEMEVLLATFGVNEEGAGGGIGPAAIALYALLVWLALPAFASLALGWLFLRYSSADAPGSRADR